MVAEETVYNDGRFYFYEYIFCNDDTTMEKYLTHPEKRSTGKVNIGGRLSKNIPVPTWFAEPKYRSK